MLKRCIYSLVVDGTSGQHTRILGACASSPPHNAGTTYSGQPSHFYDGIAQTSPLTIGALEVYTSPIPAVSISGSVKFSGVLIQ
jgi:hypothetical protein